MSEDVVRLILDGELTRKWRFCEIAGAPAGKYIDIDDGGAGWAACEMVALAFGYGDDSELLDDHVLDLAGKLRPNPRAQAARAGSATAGLLIATIPSCRVFDCEIVADLLRTGNDSDNAQQQHNPG